MIDYEYPSLFITEGTTKSLLITDGEVTVSGTGYTVSNDTITFDNDDLEAEAFELKQSLNSSDQITFGSCEAAQIRFTARKAYSNSIQDNSIVGTVLKLYLIPNHDASKMLQFGVYKVDEDKTTQDKNRHIITAYDAMYDILNKDVTDWYDDILQDEEATCTIEDFRDSFLNQFDLDVESTTLVNDNITIRRTIEKDRISGAEIIKAICEINGVFGTITNEGKFRFVALPNQIWGNDPLPEIPVSMYAEESHRDRVLSIQKLIIRCNDKTSMTVGTPQVAEYNTYVISYNPLISDFTMEELRPVAFGLYQIVKGHAYAACSISALGNPLFEVGDAVKVFTKSGSSYRTFIFERRLRGIQALRDTYSANGERYLSENLNSSYTQSKTMESQISQITSGSGAYGTDKNFPEIIRNIGFRLLDEPSSVSVEFDENSSTVKLKWTDPPDILTNEPVPCTWAGTIVVRKEGSPPRHRWDGTLIVESTTRNEYSVTPFEDDTVENNKSYYYGIFPYDTKGDYRFTKVVLVESYNDNFIEIIDVATNGNLGIVKISVPEFNNGITLKYKKESDLNWTSVLITDNMLYTTISGSPLFYTYVVDSLTSNTNYEFKIENGNYTSAVITAYTSVKTSVFNYNYQKTKVVYGQGCTVTSNDSDQTFTLSSIAGNTDCYTDTYQDFNVPSSQFITLTPDNLTYTKLVFYSIGHLLQGSGNTNVRNMLFKGSSSEEQFDDGIQGTIAFNSKTEVYVPIILSIEGYTANDIFTMRYGMLVEEGETASVKYDDIMIWFE